MLFSNLLATFAARVGLPAGFAKPGNAANSGASRKNATG
jgi:hypothetical protein